MQWSLFLLILMGQCSFLVCHLYEYHFIEETKTWEEAQMYCRANYTDLATVSNMTDIKRLRDKSQNEAWIGLYWAWHWSLPGVEFNKNKTRWADGEPNSEAPPENCVGMDSNDKWTDFHYTHRFLFICYNDTTQLDNKFHFIMKRKTWPQAQKYCREHHTDLASGLQQIEDNEFKKEKQKYDKLWIGLFRDTWRWSDGSSVSFRNWQTDSWSGSEECAVTNLNGKWMNRSCTEKKPFFCYEGQCPPLECHPYEYHFIEETKTWEEAQTYCRAHYTDLAKVFDMTDVKRLRGKNQDEAWIGLYNQIPANRTWHWSLPGVEFNKSETRWAYSEPSKNPKVPENCVTMIKKNDKWKDFHCTRRFPFICYNETNQATKFYFIDDAKTWPEAQKYCREYHTDLVSGLQQIKEVKELIKGKWNANFLWIGLFRDTWRWSDGSSFSFRKWKRYKLSGSKNCGVTTSDGKWMNKNCNERKPFFCYEDNVILIKENKTWEEALYYCQDHHHDLVSITNLDEQRWVQERAKMANTPHVWLGLRYTCTLGFWFWISDKAVIYNNWGSPGRTDECDMSGAMDSGAMDRGGQHKWFKKIDHEEFNFICSK